MNGIQCKAAVAVATLFETENMFVFEEEEKNYLLNEGVL